MIAALIPLAVARFGVGIAVIAEDEADGGNVDREERVLVGAMQQLALGLAVGADLNVQGLGNGPCRVAESGIVESLGREESQRKQRTQLVEVDVGGDLFDWYRGMSDEPI